METRRTAMGPFEIETRRVRIASGRFPNTSGNSFETVPVTYFALRHRGRPIGVPRGGEEQREFWDAHFLGGAPRPAVLLADTTVHLVVERDGALAVQTLVERDGDMASYQWLDARAGQPGDECPIGIHDGSDESRTLAGGSLLLVGRRRVLDVTTLETYPFRLNDTQTLESVGQFYAAGTPVVALSPGRTQIVAIGNRSRDAGYDYAVVVVDFRRRQAYALPFDQDAMRFESAADVGPDWLAHYFEWTTGAGGAERLRPRAHVAPLPWVGRLVRFGGDGVEYRLRRARPELLGTLVAFLEREFAATIERIGARFDAELRTGEHQRQFGSAATS